jgi:hypothetical protein
MQHGARWSSGDGDGEGRSAVPQDRQFLYASRLNSFKVGAEHYWPGKNRITTVDLLERDRLRAAEYRARKRARDDLRLCPPAWCRSFG